MNLVNNNSSNNTDDMADENTTNYESLAPQNTNAGNSAVVSTLSNLPEAQLGLTNILNIILIVIGVLLILLAIAIIIRLKH